MKSLSKPPSRPGSMPLEVWAVVYDVFPALVLSVLVVVFMPGTKFLFTPLRRALPEAKDESGLRAKCEEDGCGRPPGARSPSPGRRLREVDQLLAAIAEWCSRICSSGWCCTGATIGVSLHN